MALISDTKHKEVAKTCRNKSLFVALGKYNEPGPLKKTTAVVKKVNHKHTISTRHSFPGVYAREYIGMLSLTKMCIQFLMTVLFRIAKVKDQSKGY